MHHFILSVLTLAGTACVTATGWAQSPEAASPATPSQLTERIEKELDLSDDQRVQLREIMAEFAQEDERTKETDASATQSDPAKGHSHGSHEPAHSHTHDADNGEPPHPEMNFDAKQVEHLEEAIEQWADRLEQRMESRAEELERRLDSFADKVDDWVEEVAKEWETWAEEHEEEWEHWAETYAERWKVWAKKLEGEIETDGDPLEEVIQGNMKMLSEMPLEPLIEQMAETVQKIEDAPWAELEDVKRVFQEAITQSQKAMQDVALERQKQMKQKRAEEEAALHAAREVAEKAQTAEVQRQRNLAIMEERAAKAAEEVEAAVVKQDRARAIQQLKKQLEALRKEIESLKKSVHRKK